MKDLLAENGRIEMESFGQIIFLTATQVDLGYDDYVSLKLNQDQAKELRNRLTELIEEF